jgi:hypothetical protein
MNARLETRRQLIQYLCNQLLVFEDFPHLHDAYYGRLDQQLAVLLDVFVGCLLLHFQFCLHWYVDVDTQFFAAIHQGNVVN